MPGRVYMLRSSRTPQSCSCGTVQCQSEQKTWPHVVLPGGPQHAALSPERLWKSDETEEAFRSCLRCERKVRIGAE